MSKKHPILPNKLEMESNSPENDAKSAHSLHKNVPKTAHSSDITSDSAPEALPPIGPCKGVSRPALERSEGRPAHRWPGVSFPSPSARGSTRSVGVRAGRADR